MGRIKHCKGLCKLKAFALLVPILVIAQIKATEIRQSRHLDYRTSIFPEDYKHVLEENHNHKPLFVNCSSYAPVIKEEEPPGLEVIKVHAVDIDPPHRGGTITYSFVTAPGEKLKFEINNRTGLIRTTQTLDRDEPAREKSVYLTVLATDNGRPQLDDVCTFKVTIEDINDNAPVFDKVAYVESVPQDLPIGQEVMRVSATDIDDGNNSVVRYSISAKKKEDEKYFRVDRNTGVIFLDHLIDKPPGYKFVMSAMATDQGEDPKYSEINLDIRVVESHKKAPTFLYVPAGPITLMENFSDFSASIAHVEAVSNIVESPDYFLFELVTGRTEQTNKDNTFRLESKKNVAHIMLSKPLDYETITEYTLIVRVTNKYQIAAETVINIEVDDVNDNIPVFRKKETGSVLENEPAGTFVMQVRAIDADGTIAHNIVSYKLANYFDLFTIDPDTGNITTLTDFDREKEMYYPIKVIATDNSPSAILRTGEHNKGEQNFQIEIADKNDNAPRFTQSIYVANSIAEDANINSLVTEVKAVDADTASPVIYSIEGGNVNQSFYIENTTGKIRVNKPLDYEQITEYNLTVKAHDGIYSDIAHVIINVLNVNDNPPIFGSFNRNPVILEETMIEGCITTVVAYDPDIKDRSADQHIVYSILKTEHKPYIAINNSGCMYLKKPLDRDPPHGYPVWTVHVIAQDEDGGPTSQREVAAVNITLIDINDNAPFLDMPYPVIWDENKRPGRICELRARDYDSEENGPPFTYRINHTAGADIFEKFEIRGDDLYARVEFDREQRKSYDILIDITDSGTPPMTGHSILTVIIGDKNDNAMKEGTSSIFVYDYKGESRSVEIGRVYVDDPDDWDLGDKYFVWQSEDHVTFELDQNTGMITMLEDTPSGTFFLRFRVVEQSEYIPRHEVSAYVNVTVKEIPEEAVVNSGSIRFTGINAEDFVTPDIYGISKRDRLQAKLATLLAVPVENVDVFTVLRSPHHNNCSLLDVRFSAHNSPYYAPERLNTEVASRSKDIEREVEAVIYMINIDECLVEGNHCWNQSCKTYLNVSLEPYTVYTNVSSFVGVNAVVDPLCTCIVAEPITCLNGGVPLEDRCECPPGLDGPRCEQLTAGFAGDGYAILPPRGQACDNQFLSLELAPHKEDGLVFYFGPTVYNPLLEVRDFMALELRKGYPYLVVDYGTGTANVTLQRFKLNDGKFHRIDILLGRYSIEMKVDGCSLSSCMALVAPRGPNVFLNINGAMQVGGTLSDLPRLAHEFRWDYTPSSRGFVGCVRNITFNGDTYNLGQPGMEKNMSPTCSQGTAVAVSFGIDTNFLLAVTVCSIILLILLFAVVVRRKKTDDLYKDMDDIRENIINYEDEGGGEVDTAYDLNALRAMYEQPLDSKIATVGLQGREADEVPDICEFLDGKKESCDKDPDGKPFDDVRHYAYEGEGNSEGSLSSLASCTDDGDLRFDYLSNFGPRFGKLADMYGEEPSDEEKESIPDREDKSWC